MDLRAERRFIVAYLRAVGRQWVALVITGAAGVFSVVDWFYPLEVPAWLGYVVAGGGLVAAQYLAFRDTVGTEYDLRAEQIAIESRQRCVPVLRSAIRRGRKLQPSEDYYIATEEDTKRLIAWIRDTFHELRKHDRSVAERFGDAAGVSDNVSFRISEHRSCLERRLTVLEDTLADIKRD